MQENQTSTTYLVEFEGNIGAGKSTLMSNVHRVINRDEFDVVLMDEPVHEWIESGMFESYGDDPAANAFRFQMHVFRDRLKKERALASRLSRLPGNHVILCERSNASNSIFAQVNAALGNMTAANLEEYVRNVDAAGPRMLPDLCVYLTNKPDACLKNIKRRSRRGEENLTVEYLSALDAAHAAHDWSNAGRTVVIRVLNAHREIVDAANVLAECISSACSAKHYTHTHKNID